jgi:hypothetical protein
MPYRAPEGVNDVTVYLVLNDYGGLGRAYAETDPADSDRETVIRSFLADQYENANCVVAFNTAEGWSGDVSEDVALEILQRAIDADENLGSATKRFIDRHIDDPANPPARAQTSPIDLANGLKPDFEKRPAAPSVRRKATPVAGQRKDHDCAFSVRIM